MNIHDIKKRLWERDLKATPVRIRLLARMQEYKSAMPYSTIQKEMKDIDRVTLYRTLEKLKEQGIIHKAFHGDKESYFAICGNRCRKGEHHHGHVHFRCIRCESVTCEKTENTFQISIPGSEIDKVSIQVEGLCKTCIGFTDD